MFVEEIEAKLGPERSCSCKTSAPKIKMSALMKADAIRKLTWGYVREHGVLYVMDNDELDPSNPYLSDIIKILENKD